jgi:hypothetical protein
MEIKAPTVIPSCLPLARRGGQEGEARNLSSPSASAPPAIRHRAVLCNRRPLLILGDRHFGFFPVYFFAANAL